MSKISFNAQALGIATYHQCGNVGGPEADRTRVAVVRPDASIKSLFERLGFTNVESFPSCGDLPAQDVDT